MKEASNAAVRSRARGCALGLSVLLPLLMGGCPEFREDVVGVFETATRTALLGTEDEWTIASVARVSCPETSSALRKPTSASSERPKAR